MTRDNARISFTYVAPNLKEANGKPKNSFGLKHSLHYEHCKVEQLALNYSSLFCDIQSTVRQNCEARLYCLGWDVRILWMTTRVAWCSLTEEWSKKFQVLEPWTITVATLLGRQLKHLSLTNYIQVRAYVPLQMMLLIAKVRDLTRQLETNALQNWGKCLSQYRKQRILCEFFPRFFSPQAAIGFRRWLQVWRCLSTCNLSCLRRNFWERKSDGQYPERLWGFRVFSLLWDLASFIHL